MGLNLNITIKRKGAAARILISEHESFLAECRSHLRSTQRKRGCSLSQVDGGMRLLPGCWPLTNPALSSCGLTSSTLILYICCPGLRAVYNRCPEGAGPEHIHRPSRWRPQLRQEASSDGSAGPPFIHAAHSVQQDNALHAHGRPYDPRIGRTYIPCVVCGHRYDGFALRRPTPLLIFLYRVKDYPSLWITPYQCFCTLQEYYSINITFSSAVQVHTAIQNDYTTVNVVLGLQRFFPLCPRSDQGWLHKAVDVGGQLHIIEELQAFEQEPINNVVISEKQVAHPNIRICHFFRTPSECALRPRWACTWPPRQAWFSSPSPAARGTSPATTASLPGTLTVPGTKHSAWR